MNWLLTPLAVLGLFTLISFAIYWAAGRLSPKVEQTEDKLMAYASGENIEGVKAPQTYSLFHVAFIFTVLHVAVILLALLPDTGDAMVALAFLGGVAMATFALVTGGETDD